MQPQGSCSIKGACGPLSACRVLILSVWASSGGGARLVAFLPLRNALRVFGAEGPLSIA